MILFAVKYFYMLLVLLTETEPKRYFEENKRYRQSTYSKLKRYTACRRAQRQTSLKPELYNSLNEQRVVEVATLYFDSLFTYRWFIDASFIMNLKYSEF